MDAVLGEPLQNIPCRSPAQAPIALHGLDRWGIDSPAASIWCGATKCDAVVAGPRAERVYVLMLSVRRKGERGPLLVMLHWLGGSTETWTEISDGLSARGVRCLAVDLPGFGASANTGGFNVAAMAQAVVETIAAERANDAADARSSWVLAGHSMGGKLAAVIARRALDGEPELRGLRGLVLVSPSPPGPEPMSEDKRSSSLAALGESTGKLTDDRKRAGGFVDDNTGDLALPEQVRERAIDGVLRMNRTAFRMWMEHGSREDWSERVGVLSLPAIVFAGTEDKALGPVAQKKHTLPHLEKAELISLEGAGHLAPLERPGVLIEQLTQFLANLDLPLTAEQTTLGAVFRGLLSSAHVSSHTRDVMEARQSSATGWDYTPVIFTAAELRVLRALAERILPHAGFDLAARLDAQLASGEGDGWRFATLPPDVEAAHCGLLSFDLAAKRAHGVSFVALFPEQQDALLQQALDGGLGRGLLGTLHIGDGADAFSAAELQQWCQDLLAAFTRFYVADPRMMERIGYTGFADDLGFTQIQIGQTQDFER